MVSLSDIPIPARQIDDVDLMRLVDLMMGIPSMSEAAFRQSLVEELPLSIRGMIRRSEAPRMDVRGILRTARDYPDGLRAVAEAVILILGPTSAADEFRSTVLAVTGTASTGGGGR